MMVAGVSRISRSEAACPGGAGEGTGLRTGFCDGFVGRRGFGHRDRNARWRDACSGEVAGMVRCLLEILALHWRDTVPEVCPMVRRRPDGMGVKGTQSLPQTAPSNT